MSDFRASAAAAKVILAMSGGIDSMVLMHIFRHEPGVVVAHFDHGTRPSAAADAEFVQRAAAAYGLPCVVGHGRLGAGASEEAARRARYRFLRDLRGTLGGTIYTAHHGNDLLESVAINLWRGTGWRGLAPFGDPAVRRPLIDTELLPAAAREELVGEASAADSGAGRPAMGGGARAVADGGGGELACGAPIITRREIYRYAARHGLSFRQDPTNVEENYLRNRLRPAVAALPAEAQQRLYALYQDQRRLKQAVDELCQKLLPQGAPAVYQRRWFMEGDQAAERGLAEPGQPAQTAEPDQSAQTSESASLAQTSDPAIELLRAALARAGISATRPQLADFLRAIRTYAPGKQFNLPGGRLVTMKKHTFVL